MSGGLRGELRFLAAFIFLFDCLLLRFHVERTWPVNIQGIRPDGVA